MFGWIVQANKSSVRSGQTKSKIPAVNKIGISEIATQRVMGNILFL